MRCRRLKQRCDREPETCPRCIKANAECVRKPRGQAERAKPRQKRRLRPSIFEDTDDSSWSNDFSFDSEGNQGWKTPLEHDDSRGIISSQRSNSAPPVQSDPAHHFVREDPATLNSQRNESPKAANLDTTSPGKPADYTTFHHKLSLLSVDGRESRTDTSATQDALRRPVHSIVPNQPQRPISQQRDSSKVPNSSNTFKGTISHQWNNVTNTTTKALISGVQKSPGSRDRPLLDFWGAQKPKDAHETDRKRSRNTIGQVTEGGIKRMRISPPAVEASLPRDMRLNTMLSVSLNGDKPSRAKQTRLGDCKSMAALFAEITRGWKDEGVNEEDCYIEVTYDWKSETDEGRTVYLERDHESGLKDLYDEIRENPCWDYEADAWCILNMRICQKY